MFNTRPFNARAKDPALPILLKARLGKSLRIQYEWKPKDPSSFIDFIMAAIGSTRPAIHFEAFYDYRSSLFVLGGLTLIRLPH